MLPSGVLIFDVKVGSIVFANQEIKKVTGYSKSDPLGMISEGLQKFYLYDKITQSDLDSDGTAAFEKPVIDEVKLSKHLSSSSAESLKSKVKKESNPKSNIEIDEQGKQKTTLE